MRIISRRRGVVSCRWSGDRPAPARGRGSRARFLFRTKDMKAESGSSAMTVHTDGNNRGCRTRARLRSASEPPSNRSTLVTEGVHSGQRSTSLITRHTRSSGASMSTVTLAIIARPSVGWSAELLDSFSLKALGPRVNSRVPARDLRDQRLNLPQLSLGVRR
jgi:hypothetical protein